MTTRIADDGTIEVRVVLYVRVGMRDWAENMMGEHPDEVHHTDVRGSVKGYVRGLVDHASKELHSTFSQIDPVPITSVVVDTPDNGPVQRRS